MKYIFFILILLLTGCTSGRLDATPAGDNLQSTDQLQITGTATQAVITPNNRPITPSPTELPTSTPTKLPVRIKTPTSTALPDHLELPDWLKSSDNQDLFMALTGETDNGYRLSIIDPKSKQQFDLLIPKTSAYFWSSDGNGINILNKDLKVKTIDLQTGNVTDAVIDPSVFQFRRYGDNFPYSLIARGNPGEPGFSLNSLLYDISFDYKYAYHYYNDLKETKITVEDLSSGEFFTATATTEVDGIYNGETQWSPVSDQLAILQTKTLPTGPDYYPAFRLLIYDANQRSITKSFNGDFSNIKWSHDGKKILFQRKALPGEPIALSSVPCILDLQTAESKCYFAIKYYEDSNGLSTILSNFDWLPGDKGIMYLTDRGASQPNGNFCVYYFADGKINCPTNGIGDLAGDSVIDYSLSPTGDYFVFTFDQSGPLNDFRVEPRSALIKIDGTGYLPLWMGSSTKEGGTSDQFIGDLVSNTMLWRPAQP